MKTEEVCSHSVSGQPRNNIFHIDNNMNQYARCFMYPQGCELAILAKSEPNARWRQDGIPCGRNGKLGAGRFRSASQARENALSGNFVWKNKVLCSKEFYNGATIPFALRFHRDGVNRVFVRTPHLLIIVLPSSVASGSFLCTEDTVILGQSENFFLLNVSCE